MLTNHIESYKVLYHLISIYGKEKHDIGNLHTLLTAMYGNKYLIKIKQILNL